jgi:aquaporin Z
MFYTFMLCFVVLNCAVSKRNNPSDDPNQFYGVAIALVVVAGGYAVSTISGACFNPAVAIGLSVTTAVKNMTYPVVWAWVWSCFELMGSLLASVLFLLMRREETDTSNEDKYSFATIWISEFVGTFMLVITVGLNIVTASTTTALSAAAALMSMIYSLGDISGAHFNPAVTLAVVLSGRKKLAPRTGIAYVAAQLLGAALAGHFYGGYHMVASTKDISYPLEPLKPYHFFSAGMVELFFTAVLAYTVLAVATAPPPASQATMQNSFFGLSIAGCVIAGGFAIGGISGGELNPAVSLGISVSNLAHSGSGSVSPPINFVPFSLFQLSGGMLAAMTFHLTHSHLYSGPPTSSQPLDSKGHQAPSVGVFESIANLASAAKGRASA